MLEIYPKTDSKNRPISLALTFLNLISVGDLSPGESKPFEDHIKLYAEAGGTLGNFTLTRKGMVTLNPETGLREFKGHFIFNDTFDFNSSTHRPFWSEMQVRFAKYNLVGKPFKITGKLSVHQIQGGGVTAMLNGFPVSPTNFVGPPATFERKNF